MCLYIDDFFCVCVYVLDRLVCTVYHWVLILLSLRGHRKLSLHQKFIETRQKLLCTYANTCIPVYVHTYVRTYIQESALGVC